MTTPFPAAKISLIPILDSGLKQADLEFPIRRIYCVGRNYAAHAREMGHSEREAPFFFSKPADSVAVNPSSIAYPTLTDDLHHEVELVIAIGKEASAISSEQAESVIYGYALGIDLTKRDLQSAAKLKGRPWDMAKGFDQSAPISSILPFTDSNQINQGTISLSVNQQIKQQGQLSHMIWSPAEVIAELSQHVALKPGDLIFTGTPEGVGAIRRGDLVEANLDKRLRLSFKIE